MLRLLERASTYRPGAKRDIVSLTKFSLRMLARRAIELEEEIAEIDAILKSLVNETAPNLSPRSASAPTPHRRSWSQPVTIRNGSATRQRLPPLRRITARRQQRQERTTSAQPQW